MATRDGAEGSIAPVRGRTLVPGLVAGALLVLSLLVLIRVPYEISGAVVVAPLLLLLSAPLLRRAKRTEPDSWVSRLFLPALVSMLLAATLRYWVSFDYYDGRVDAAKYSRAAIDVADQIRSGILVPAIDPDLGGGRPVVFVTGVIYALIGPSILGAFLVWAWIGFWGLYFCYRAFEAGVPGGDKRRYALLIFFLPSLLFWTAAVGKEAWMILSIGLTLWGAALLFRRRAFSVVPLLGGLAGTALVRPHITVLLYGALTVAVLLRRSLATDRLGPAVKLGLVLLLIPVGALILQRASTFLQVDSLNAETVVGLLEETTEQTADVGDSTFASVRVTSVLEVPYAAVSVLFRPFPWEADDALLLGTALEGALLMIIATLSVRRWVRIPRVDERAYVILAVTYLLGFVIAFSSLGNFGLLARERIMVFPLLFVLLSLTRTGRPAGDGDDAPTRLSGRDPAAPPVEPALR